ncbi:MAG: CRISPR-associated protein Csx20 [Desulfocapsaceae bacterium]|nr:CRISPR-associated protein Csx20 [Desulfocapsaceae bacterium]
MNINTTNPTLFLLFNHNLTAPQETDARTSLGVDRIVLPPLEISRCWVEIPPDAEELASYLAPVFTWLGSEAISGDFVLIQGEFGATFLLVHEAIRLGLVPVYSTTIRQAVEQHLPDGQVKISHIFSHVRYRKYTSSVKNVAGALANYAKEAEPESPHEIREKDIAPSSEDRD